MCTLSFLPAANGFYLAMNRDEQRTRVVALPPEIEPCGASMALYPREPNGGTWIGLNRAGTAVALLNWYSVPKRQEAGAVSRGVIVPRMLAHRRGEQEAVAWDEMDLPRFHPFRVVTVFPRERRLREWRWNGEKLVHEEFTWQRQHWFSSGYDEPGAQRSRADFVEIQVRNDALFGADPLAWLRKVHASHEPECGPFSICMHRADAQTVSYTEITVQGDAAAMYYNAGSPCNRLAPRFTQHLSLESGSDAPFLPH